MWLRLDTEFADHPKVLEAGPDAALAWLRLLSYSVRQGTDGKLPPPIVARETAELVDRLIDVGLLDRREGNVVIHDYLDYQVTAEEWQGKQRARSEHARKAARARWDAQRNAPSIDSGRCSGNATTRHDTTQPPPSGEGVRGRASRIPIPFRLTDEMLAFARPLSVNIEKETEKFVDYWKAQPGQKGVKLDWPATWRNWMRRASER